MRLLVAVMMAFALSAQPLDVTGKWYLSVDLEDGSHGSPILLLEQTGTTVRGEYRGPFGMHSVRGLVEAQGWLRTRPRFLFRLEFQREGKAVRAVYDAELTPPGDLKGTVELSGALARRGVFTGVRSRDPLPVSRVK